MKRHIFDVDAKTRPRFAPDQNHAMDQPGQPMIVERYARQRLYHPATAAYLTRDDLMTMAKSGEKFVVIDAHTGDDVTPAYQPIILEH
jgi:polyhydroxyalkanoate synthesis regulator protein